MGVCCVLRVCVFVSSAASLLCRLQRVCAREVCCASARRETHALLKGHKTHSTESESDKQGHFGGDVLCSTSTAERSVR